MGQEQGKEVLEQPVAAEVPVQPFIGKPIKVFVQSPDTGDVLILDKYQGRFVTGDWTIGQLLKILEVRLRVHRACLRLNWNGLEVHETETIQVVSRCESLERLPSRVYLRLDVVGRDKFPERLMSFA